MDMAEDLLAGRNPYHRPFDFFTVPYPLTAAIFGLPLVLAGVSLELGTGIFMGASVGLLTLGLTRRGYVGLYALLAAPFWGDVFTTQWAPMMMVAAFYPILSFVVLVKPQTALPIVLTHANRAGIVVTALVAIGSLIVMPTWPWEFIEALGMGYGPDGFVIDRYLTYRYSPLTAGPGVIAVLLLRHLRDRHARLLLIAAFMPTSSMFILWLIPRTRGEYLWTAAVSWIGPLVVVPCTFLFPACNVALGNTFRQGFFETILCYVPMVILVLRRNWQMGRPGVDTEAPA